MTRSTFLLTLTAFSLAQPFSAAVAQTKQLSLEHRMLLRCSAAFALVAHGQGNSNREALSYPDLNQRGREFFVRASATVMEEAGLDRAAISAALSVEAQDLLDNDTLDDVMQVCMPLLPPE